MAYETSKLTAVPYFYDKQLRRYIQQFIRIFAGFQVAMHSDAEGNTVYQQKDKHPNWMSNVQWNKKK